MFCARLELISQSEVPQNRNTWRRFEFLLPLRFNDGQAVPDRAVGQTLEEIQARFGAVSWETQSKTLQQFSFAKRVLRNPLFYCDSVTRKEN
jgi:hypothetical protein